MVPSVFPRVEAGRHKVVSQCCCGGWLRRVAIVVKSVLCLWMLLVSRRDCVYLYAHGLLEPTGERSQGQSWKPAGFHAISAARLAIPP